MDQKALREEYIPLLLWFFDNCIRKIPYNYSIHCGNFIG